MKSKMLVATRKGLFIYKRSGTSWKIATTAFLGEPVSMVFDDERHGHLFAALNLGHFGCKLHRSADDGKTWTEVGVPQFDPAPEGEKGYTLKMIWSLEAAGDAQGLWCGTIPGALFYSSDHGQTWQINRSLWNEPSREKWGGGGYDEPGLHSICVHPKDPAEILVAISTGGVWKTRDAGKSWKVCGKGLRAEYMPPDQAHDPIMQDAHRLVRSPANPDLLWIQHHNGIFVSKDNAESWTELTPGVAPAFGFAVAAHPHDTNTAWFVPGVKDACRIPKDGQLVVTRTRDGGKSFEVLRRGLPQEHAYDIVLRHCLEIDLTSKVLCLGSTTGNLFISEDQGENFQALSHHLPPIYAVRLS